MLNPIDYAANIRHEASQASDAGAATITTITIYYNFMWPVLTTQPLLAAAANEN